MIKKLEAKVNNLVEESTEAAAMNDLQTVTYAQDDNVVCTSRIHSVVSYTQALDKAREAARKERMLCKQREQAQLAEQINLDLTYCVSWGYEL